MFQENTLRRTVSELLVAGFGGFLRLNSVYIGVDGIPEMRFISLKDWSGREGFEPPTPWSRIRF
jgi:hypothetical protein